MACSSGYSFSTIMMYFARWKYFSLLRSLALFPVIKPALSRHIFAFAVYCTPAKISLTRLTTIFKNMKFVKKI
jgi:hypothetical protein